jgi:DNA replication protein DnaC
MEKLGQMKLHGMANALRQWSEGEHNQELSVEDLLGIMADSEWVYRENNKLTSRLRRAKLRQAACIEDIDYATGRGLTKKVINELASSRWVAANQNVIITGATGVGKSYIACALGQKACRDGYAVLYKRTSLLMEELIQARADGTYRLALRRLAKSPVLILDDFGLQAFGPTERRDLLEVLEDRYDRASTVVTTQLEPNVWHGMIGDETIADSICDRLVHGSYRLKLRGESMRKKRASNPNGSPKTKEAGK